MGNNCCGGHGYGPNTVILYESCGQFNRHEYDPRLTPYISNEEFGKLIDNVNSVGKRVLIFVIVTLVLMGIIMLGVVLPIWLQYEKPSYECMATGARECGEYEVPYLNDCCRFYCCEDKNVENKNDPSIDFYNHFAMRFCKLTDKPKVSKDP